MTFRRIAQCLAPVGALGAVLLAGLVVTANPRSSLPESAVRAPAALRPDSPTIFTTAPARQAPAPIDLTAPGAFEWRTAPATLIDTTTFPVQTQLADAVPQRLRRVKEILPPHEHPVGLPVGLANDLPVGGLLERPRADPGALFPGISQTGWVPPDPTLAVGPAHIVTTVNQSIAFLTKLGFTQFSADLGSPGNPGFFEEVGAQNFVFDPKCFYDHYAGRFVVVAPEVYNDDEAWITFAVSDDDNPNGVWHKYRTDAVIQVGDTTYWWDYPGFGFDQDAYYVTSNLFGLNQSGWGGVGFRVIDKASVLAGGPADYATLRDGSAGSVQSAQQFRTSPAPYFVSLASSSALRIQALLDPLGSPQLVDRVVPIPPYSGPGAAPAAGGNTVNLVDARIFNAHWRDGNLYACHNIWNGQKNVARWYHLDTGDWPAGGDVSLVQAGEVDPGGDTHTWFPAIYSNKHHEVGLVVGASSPSQRIALNVTGRTPADPPGAMGALTQVRIASVNGGGRWGDYYDIALDPVDKTTFWVIGEYPEPFGWQTWLASFKVTDAITPIAVPDDAGRLLAGGRVAVDVLANDYHTADAPLAIETFDETSQQGGPVSLSAGTGPDGRDELAYAAPAGLTGTDTFSYVISDPNGLTSAATVSIQVSQGRAPDAVGALAPGLQARYYALTNPFHLPDFAALAPYAAEIVPQVDFAATSGPFAGSGRANSVGAVFEGYLSAPQSDFYQLYLESDDGSRLWIGDTLVVDNDDLHGMEERSGVIALHAGPHALRIEFFELSGDAGLVARIAGQGIAKQPIPAAWLGHAVACASDLNADGVVDLTDLAVLLANFGANGPAPADGDVDGDGDVDLQDLAVLLADFGVFCG